MTSTASLQLLEAGIDQQVGRKDKRSAVEEGCGVCVSFYELVRGYDHIPELQLIWVFDDVDAGLDDQEPLIN